MPSPKEQAAVAGQSHRGRGHVEGCFKGLGPEGRVQLQGEVQSLGGTHTHARRTTAATTAATATAATATTTAVTATTTTVSSVARSRSSMDTSMDLEAHSSVPQKAPASTYSTLGAWGLGGGGQR